MDETITSSKVLNNSKLAYITVRGHGKLMDIGGVTVVIQNLPSNQQGALRAIWEHGSTTEQRPSFLWENRSTSVKLTLALAKKGLLVGEEYELVYYAGTINERRVMDTRYRVHPLVAKIYEDQKRERDVAQAARWAERDAKQAQESLERDSRTAAIADILAAYPAEFASLMAHHTDRLRTERGL